MRLEVDNGLRVEQCSVRGKSLSFSGCELSLSNCSF